MAPKRQAPEPTVSPSHEASSDEEEGEEEEEVKEIQKGPTKPSTSKKPVRSSKRTKKKDKPEPKTKKPSEEIAGDETEKKLFQRLWSDDDEVAILKGLIAYKEKNGSYPSDMADLLSLIRKSLGVEASASQLKDKVRRLHRKYSNNAARKKFNPSKPHDKQAFDLSAKIWGSESPPPPTSSAAAVAEEKKLGASVGPNWERLIGGLGIEKGVAEFVLRSGVEGLMGNEKAAKLEAELRKLEVAEMELFVRRNELMCEQMKLVLKALKSSDQV